MSGAMRATVWRIADGVLSPISSVGGVRPPAQRAAGDPLAWAAAEHMAVRLDPPPSWASARYVFAVGIDMEARDVVLTLELMSVEHVRPDQFNGLALQVGAMLRLEAERHELNQQHVHAQELLDALRLMPEATDTDALVRELAHASNSIVGGLGAALSEWDNETGKVIAVEGDGPDVGTMFRGTDSETALAIRAGTMLVRKPGELGRLPVVSVSESFARRPKSMVAVPLRVSEETIGVLTVWSQNEILPEQQQHLQTLARYAALQLRYAHEFGVMRTRAEHDALTGLANRHAFETFLGGETSRYARYQRPFSLVMLDIDHFKSVNDRYGHEAGDYILQQVSHVVRASLRNVDFAARIGGEEFVVLAPETSLADGLEIAERIRRRVEELTPNWRGQDIPVRISVGVSGVPACVRDPSVLMRSADAALYESKRSGRNRVTVAPTYPA